MKMSGIILNSGVLFEFEVFSFLTLGVPSLLTPEGSK